MFQHAHSGLREQQPASGALKKPLPVLGLQLADMTGHRGLRNIKFLGSLRKTEVARGRTKYL